MIDNLSIRHTPEGTSLSLMPAGIVPRFGAWVMDLVIRAVIMVVLGLLLMLFSETGTGLMLIVFFLVDWFYGVLFEVYWHGQTIGKKRYGIKVCTDDGMAVGWRTSMIRNLLRVADFLPIMFASGAISMIFHGQNKRLGDIVAGTMVVYVFDPKDERKTDVKIQEVASDAMYLSIPLRLDEQQAILSYAERQESLPDTRRNELAEILSPLTQKTGNQASDALMKIAKGITGS